MDKTVIVFLSQNDAQSLLDHARNDHPSECCGALIGTIAGAIFRIYRVMPGRNIACADRSRFFQLDWETLWVAIRRYRGTQRGVVGFYHSHPNGSRHLSESDHHHVWCGHVHVILRAPYEGMVAISAWRISNGLSQPAKVQIRQVHPCDAQRPA